MKPWQRQHITFITLLLGIVVLSGLLAVRYDKQWDLTFNQRNQLSDTSITLVKQLQSPVHITAFTRGNPKVKALISRILTRYQRHGDIHWTFKNPDAEIDAVRRYGISRDGELLITYQGQSVLINTLSETAISRGLYTLLQGKTRHVLFATGQGEHDFSGDDSSFSQLKKRLQREDVAVESIDLAISQRVPDNIDLLVLAAPQFAYDEVEVTAIGDYVKRGGRVLWLASQANNARQAALSGLLGVRFDAGMLMGQVGKTYGFNDPAYVPIVPKKDEKNALLAGIDTLLVFPQASPIQILPSEAAKKWQVQPMLSVTGDWVIKNQQTVVKAKTPIVIGLSLISLDSSQRGRVLLIGDADFATNRFIGQGQNGDFAVNMISQLAAPDTAHIRIDNDVPPPVVLSPNTLAYLALSTILGVPLLVLLLGFIVRRRGQV